MNEIKDPLPEEFYIDKNGYKRYKKDDKLIHRNIAFYEVYRKNRNSYPKRFSEYDVHHIDRNKLNNDPSNLILKPKETHNLTHRIEWIEKNIQNLKPGSKEHEEELSNLKIKKEILWDKTVGDMFS